MFEKLAQVLKSLTRQLDYSCPAQYQDDPVAQAAGWSPASKGGSSFCTHRLERIGTERIQFKATAGAKAFAAIFMLAGLIILIISVVVITGKGFYEKYDQIILPLIGVVFTMAGLYMFRWFGRPIVFDLSAGYFWIGKGRPGDHFDTGKLKSLTPLSEVYAIQLVTEICRDKNSKNDCIYTSHELNLVLRDGSRVTVVDHGSADLLRTDADSLAVFLGVPVWDALQ